MDWKTVTTCSIRPPQSSRSVTTTKHFRQCLLFEVTKPCYVPAFAVWLVSRPHGDPAAFLPDIRVYFA